MPKPASLSYGRTSRECIEQNTRATGALFNWNSMRDSAEQNLAWLGRYIRRAYGCEEDDSEVPRRQHRNEK
jgi:hypothetical protein